MTEVELKLVAPHASAVKSIKEVANEAQKLYKAEEGYTQKRKGLIEKEIQMQKQLSERREKASNIENLKIYNKLLEDSKKRLEDLNKAGIQGNKEIEKSSSSVIDKIGKMALAYLSVKTAVVVLKETVLAFFTKSQEGMDLLERKISGLKAAVGVLQGEFIKLGKAIAGEGGNEATPWGTRLVNGLRLISTTANLIPGVSKYFDDLADRMNKAGAAAEEYTRITQELNKSESDMIVPRAKATAAIADARLKYSESNGTIQERIALLENAIALEREMAEREIKHQQFVALNLRNRNVELEKQGMLLREHELELQNAIAREIELQTASDQRQMRSINSLRTLKEESAKKALDEITKAQKAFNDYWDKVDKEEAAAAKKAAEDKWNFELKYGKQLFNQKQKEAKEIWDAMIKEEEKAAKEEERLKRERIDSIKAGLNEMLKFTQRITDNLFEDARRSRELLDTRISETQRALESEIRLYEAGYSANVAAKKKELEELQRQRAIALKNEEEALERQRQMEAISQGVNIFSSATNILKSFTKLGPTGLILAAGAISAMFAIIESVKKKSSEVTKLAAGGRGEVSGRLHSEGGERFSDHIEVEQGERWGVLSRPASRKYGKIFNEMVDSFNKDRFKSGVSINNILVQNEGPNKRLDEVNSNLRKIRAKEEVLIVGNAVIYRKGNSTRVIKR